MEYDGAKLKGKIVEVFGTQGAFAKEMGLSERTVSLKIAGLIDWKSREIARACDLLDVDRGSVGDYFLPN